MTIEHRYTGRDIAAAVRGTFNGANVCPCSNLVKLSEDQILQRLLAQGMIALRDIHDPRTMPVQTLERVSDQLLPHAAMRSLSHLVRSLGALGELTYGELMALPSIGPLAAKKIERAFARGGLLLKDGDPALLHRVHDEPDEAPAPAEVLAAGQPRTASPEAACVDCGTALLKLAKKILHDGTSLAGIAAQLTFDPKNAAKQLRHWVSHSDRPFVADVRRIAALVIGSERPKRRRSGRATAELNPDNVIPVAFSGAKSAAR